MKEMGRAGEGVGAACVPSRKGRGAVSNSPVLQQQPGANLIFFLFAYSSVLRCIYTLSSAVHV